MIDFKRPKKEDYDFNDNIEGVRYAKDMNDYANKLEEQLRLYIVSGNCSQLIADIEKLSRYDIYGTETEGSVEVEHRNDGDNIDADELYKILDNYR